MVGSPASYSSIARDVGLSPTTVKKYIQILEAVLAESLKLHYLRTKEGIEVDFAIVKNNQIEEIIEVKTSDSSIGKSLCYYHDKYDFPAVKLVMNLRYAFVENGLSCIKAENYSSNLFL